jgi:NADH-quinone oxidoreductase subunit K
LFNFHLLSFFTVDSEALLQFILRQLNVPFKIFYSLYYNLTFYDYTYLWLGFGLFFVALFGLLFGQNDLIRLLITFEILFLANIITFSFISYYFMYQGGFVIAILLLAVAAVETGIGLALLIRAHRLYKSIKITDYTYLRAK